MLIKYCHKRRENPITETYAHSLTPFGTYLRLHLYLCICCPCSFLLINRAGDIYLSCLPSEYMAIHDTSLPQLTTFLIPWPHRFQHDPHSSTLWVSSVTIFPSGVSFRGALNSGGYTRNAPNSGRDLARDRNGSTFKVLDGGRTNERGAV